MRDEMVNLAKVAAMATEEAQRAAHRVDGLEYEWLLWNEGHHPDRDAPDNQRQEPPAGNQLAAAGNQLATSEPHRAQLSQLFTPGAASPRENGEVQHDLLLLDDDPLSAWWNDTRPQGGINTQIAPLLQGPPRDLAPGRGAQLTALGEAVANAPPGIELRAASTVVRNLAGGWTEGQATHRPADQEGQRGGVSLVPFQMMDPMQPHVTIESSRAGRPPGVGPNPLQKRQRRLLFFCRSASERASPPRSVSWRGNEPSERENGTGRHASTSCAKLWSSSGPFGSRV